jgi:hypothetical protein
MWMGMCIMDLQILFKLFKEQGMYGLLKFSKLAMVYSRSKIWPQKDYMNTKIIHKDNWLVQWVLDLDWDNLKIKPIWDPPWVKTADWKIEIKWSDNEEHIHIA